MQGCTLEGALHCYYHEPSEFKKLCAFISGKHKRHVVFLGGLTDGLMACGYLTTLAKDLDAMGFSRKNSIALLSACRPWLLP